MSVVLLPPIDLARLAFFARACDVLPPDQSAEQLAEALHRANLAAWRERYPDRTPEFEGVPTDLVEVISLLIPAPDPMALIRTARDLLYNAGLGDGDPLTAVLNQIMQRAAAVHQARP